MRRTYIDSSVLIAAFRGTDDLSRRAMQALEDPDRGLVISDYVKLEVIPKPTYYGSQSEVEFMQAVFDHVVENVPASSEVTSKALEMASKYDMTPMDALHIGAALVSGVDEVLTVEKPTKPICRPTEVKVTSLHSLSEYFDK